MFSTECHSDSTLLRSDSTELCLIQPTNNEALHVLEANSEVWKGPLSLEAFIRREQLLRAVLQTARIGSKRWQLSEDISEWILTSSIKPPDARPILLSCKTVRKRALVAFNSSDPSKGRVVKEVVCQGVTSVFCEKQYRRQGYAWRTMTELAKKTKMWQADKNNECIFSVLFSDIGKEFYAKHGWHPFPSSHISLNPLAGPVKDSTLPPTTPIYEDMLDELCATDEELLRRRLSAKSDSKISVALIPAVTTFKWHHVRECFLAEELFNREVEILGAMVGDEPGKRAWCLWQRTFYRKGARKPDCSASKNTFHILRLVLEDGLATQGTSLSSHDPEGQNINSRRIDAIAALFLAAQLEAAKWEQDSVELWNATPESVLAANRALQANLHSNGVASIEPVHRETESVCSLLWHGSSNEPGLENVSWKNVEWVGNEKYNWC